MIVRGFMLLEDGDTTEAPKVFQTALNRAKEMQNVQLQAKANLGLASAYRENPRMHRVAGALFEVSASLFGAVNETSDRINALLEASAVYQSIGEIDKAISCLQRYDDRQRSIGQPPVFEARIAELRALPKKPKG